MPKIVLTDAKMKMLHSVWNEFIDLGDIVVAKRDDEETLSKAVADADLIITCYAKITRKVIRSGKKLKGILKWGVGVDAIDMVAANEEGLPVCHCPAYGAGTVADHAFAMLIALARKLVPLINTTRLNGWVWPEPSRKWAGIDLENKVVGLVGFGQIAQKMAHRCAGFNMRIKVYDPQRDIVPDEMGIVEMTTLANLLRDADFVSIHATLTPDTHHMIGEKEIRLMKPPAYIINTARGALLHEPSLLSALKERRIAGAAIDVFESEPLAASHPYYGMENVLITPHFAYYTKEADNRLDRECLYSAKRIINSETLVNVKNGDALEAMGKPVNRLPYGELPYSLDEKG